MIAGPGSTGPGISVSNGFHRPGDSHRIWDTSGLSPYLWGMVSELSATGAVPSSVVAAAVSGDSVAFARIVQAHHNDMARVCRVVCGDVELAQDATQAAWPIAWRRLHTLRQARI
jgi:hypothetical protein